LQDDDPIDDCQGDGSVEPDCRDIWDPSLGDLPFYLPHEWGELTSMGVESSVEIALIK
jgi:hypothetical protein